MRMLAAAALAIAVTATTNAAAFDPHPLTNLPAAVATGDYPKTTSILVVQNGKTVYEHYFGEGTQNWFNNTRSATKIFTALALGIAIRDGVIPSEKAMAFPYLADLKPFQNDTPDKEAITLEDMMSMSSALACDDNDDNSPGNENNLHPQQNWTRWAVDLPTMANYSRDASGYGPWRYCTTNAFLLGQIIQRATHTPVDKYIEAKILRPLGITKQNWGYSPLHETMTGGGLELRSRDWAKIAAMLANDGKWGRRQIIPKAWLDKVFTVRRASRPDQNYGYFAFQGTYETACGGAPVWYVAGNGGSQIVILRSIHAATIVTRENYNVRGTSYQTADMLQKYLLPSLLCGGKQN
jgi:CubicO group peptidase (beta-lactamase class C family)